MQISEIILQGACTRIDIYSEDATAPPKRIELCIFFIT